MWLNDDKQVAHLPPAVRHDSVSARNLYELLDILVAMRIDIGEGHNGGGAATGLSAERVQGVRELLDRAILSTRGIIDTLTRPAG